MIPVDLVVTYVDNQDPVWFSNVSKYNAIIAEQRFRSWNFLKYWFRCVEKNMSFINKVHLVVSNIEQVPDWIDQDEVDVVLHEQIIPQNLLPTFNSTTIEMYIHKIFGLAEHFIYSNDDMFAMNMITIDDFFTNDGKTIYELIHRTSAQKTFRLQCKNSYQLAAKVANVQIDSSKYFYMKHSMNPMLRSCNEELYSKAGDEIDKRCTKFREPWNFTQYLFSDYALLTNRGILGKMSFRYVKMNDIQSIYDAFGHNDVKIICLNDAGDIDDFNKTQSIVIKLFNERFPDKSRFER